MKHLITAVDRNSPAGRHQIAAGLYLTAIDHEPVYDIIDYELLTAKTNLTLTLEREDGTSFDVALRKDEYESLGLNFETGLMSPVRSCKNHCIFCFIDQMPKGIRDTLEVKDDDWRMSLIMGNYVTLTNVDEQEFERIIKRRVSPLYVSVHATDPEVRVFMMKNPAAGKIMERLTRLKEEGLSFHAQIVVCPGVNDGEVLNNTIEDLAALYPAARSLAVVPVGLTKHRDTLAKVNAIDEQKANELIDQVEKLQKKYLKELGTRFAFAADELYTKAKRELPAEETYEDYAQLENGVGLLRRFEMDFFYELDEQKPLKKKVRVDAACGRSAYGFLKELFENLTPYNISINLQPITNNFFGETVTVSGLVTSRDIADQLNKTSDTLLIPSSMLRYREDVFLDGGTLKSLSERLSMKVVPLDADDGAAFVRELFQALNTDRG